MRTPRALRKTLRYLLNKYGSWQVEAALSEMLAGPTETYQKRWAEK